jgi:hypothetical protein
LLLLNLIPRTGISRQEVSEGAKKTRIGQEWPSKANPLLSSSSWRREKRVLWAMQKKIQKGRQDALTVRAHPGSSGQARSDVVSGCGASMVGSERILGSGSATGGLYSE